MKKLPLNKGLLESAEILEIIKGRLGDFEEFNRNIKETIQDPTRFGFPD